MSILTTENFTEKTYRHDPENLEDTLRWLRRQYSHDKYCIVTTDEGERHLCEDDGRYFVPLPNRSCFYIADTIGVYTSDLIIEYIDGVKLNSLLGVGREAVPSKFLLVSTSALEDRLHTLKSATTVLVHSPRDITVYENGSHLPPEPEKATYTVHRVIAEGSSRVQLDLLPPDSKAGELTPCSVFVDTEHESNRKIADRSVRSLIGSSVTVQLKSVEELDGSVVKVPACVPSMGNQRVVIEKS